MVVLSFDRLPQARSSLSGCFIAAEGPFNLPPYVNVLGVGARYAVRANRGNYAPSTA